MYQPIVPPNMLQYVGLAFEQVYQLCNIYNN